MDILESSLLVLKGILWKYGGYMQDIDGIEE